MSTQIPANCFVPAFDIKLQQFTGSENIGGEYRALWLDAEVVVKLFVPEASVTTFAHEVAVWHRLRHPNVIKLYGACDIGHNFFVCEWASNGSLVEYLSACEKRGEKKTPWKYLHEAALGLAYLHERKIVHGNLCSNSILVGTPLFACEYASNGSLDKYLRKHPNEMWQKMHETALGVQYLHSREIIHGDLKCNNIVVGGDNKAKVTDFGLSSANFVTGAWHWVAPECLERGPSELSYASDIYAFGMCIVEALRIVETTTTKNRVLLPWGNLDNNVVKYHVTHGKLPSRPKLCTDDEWDLIKRMCTYEPKERIKISTVVDELAALAGVNKAESPEVVEPESIILSHEEFDEMKRLCRKEEHDQQETSSTNQVLLQTVYGILWDRLEDVCAMPNVEFRCLQSLFDNAWVSTRKLNQCPTTLTSFTEMAINGYALHRELDKVIDANFWVVNSTSGELHDWKMKCTTAVSTPELSTMKQENDDQ
ncbi:Serine/threonine protein kinase [Phytophthora megakarya]|uniref:Serine/threonine protein kinase n=1 Tax=Phytophthora megakarya TaxID=4795 RepID=A0A225V2Y6_9STRA|nr:Serine/threonine protein kinase [Phytophthora megakarya]